MGLLNKKPQQAGALVRFDLRHLPAERVIDLSTAKAQQKVIGRYIDDAVIQQYVHGGRYDQEVRSATKWAEQTKEVLVERRGDFPYKLLEYIDEYGNLLP